MKQTDRRRCVDAAVKHVAESHTDYQVLQIKLKMTREWIHLKKMRKTEKFDTSSLRQRADASNHSKRVLLGSSWHKDQGVMAR